MRKLVQFFLLALLVPSCGGGGGGGAGVGTPGPGPGAGTLTMEITDAPIDIRLIEKATVWVDEIRIHRQADGEDGFVTLYDGRPREVELTALRNGLTNAIASGHIEEGSYSQLRLHFAEAYLRLTNGNEYSTEEDTIKLTNHPRSGYKIYFDPPFVIEEGQTTNVLLDFDVPKSFSPIPGNNIEHARFFHLHPLIRTSVTDLSGELRGVVKKNNVLPAGETAVYVVLPGEIDPENAIASTLTEPNGSAVILGLAPGTYDLIVVGDDHQERVDGLVVTVGEATPFEVQVE